jgi:hypothetical protein
MKRTLTYAVAMGLFGALVGVGCGSDPDPNTGDTKPIALNSFVGEITKAQCAYIFECCDAAERTKVFQGLSASPKDEAECTSQLLGLMTLVYTPQTDGVKAGRQTYDGEKAKTCIDKAKSLSCGSSEVDGLLDNDPACKAIFKGTVAAGGKCEDAGDCSAQSSACPSNTCVTLQANGAACTSSDDCASKYCDAAKSVCAELLAEGKMCEYDSDCASSVCEMDVCVAKKPLGEACGFDTDCQSESCDQATKKCVAAEPVPACDGM